MKRFLRRTICASAAAIFVLAAFGTQVGNVAAQDRGRSHKSRATDKAVPPPPPPAAAAQPQKLPQRAPFTAADEAVAGVPGMPDARFWADSETDFAKALPPQPGPERGAWLILSTGGADGAFGAGLVNGLSAAGKRPDYAVVTGVSTGALMAPFVFAGPRYDAALQAVYTHTSAADIFEVGGTGESFLDTWPLKDLIAKQITPALLADIAAAHQAGRRLFIVTTDLDAERSVVWNMGAIAVHSTAGGGDEAIKLFRRILLASGSVPGAFPPVLIDVEGNGKRFAEMHADGGVGGQFFVTPPALMQSTSSYKIPADALYIVVNSGLVPEFQVVERSTPTILAQAVSIAIKADLRVLLDRAYVAAKNSGIGFNVATIPPSFNAPSRGAFDPDYMKALFNVGYDQGKSESPFAAEPPAFPGSPANGMSDPQPGANR
ncbi:MAG TPA: patatin-like phospholipase family protein [Xanthobacteraceae bacterium]|nr:patatin-like phospholipase family protein [Xanthobacteraceae bacterium]